MLCKFCNAEIEDDRLYCPICGKRQDVEINKEGQTQKPAQKGDWKLIAGVAAVLAVACLLAVAFMTGRKDNPGAGQGTTATTTETTAPESEYSQHAGIVVAKMMDTELTNDVLQMFYMTTINSFLEDYGTSLNYLGLDMEKPLSEQAYPSYDQEGGTTIETWEDFFLELALERWKNCVGVCTIAEQNGFRLDEEWTKLINEQMDSLEVMAKENNYESADAMIKTFYGDCCSVETYKTFLTMDSTAKAFYYTLYEVTDVQIEECFLENEATLKEEGITKTSGIVSNVRHILIAPEGGTTDAEGNTTYTDAEWEACKQKAEQVLGEWEENATEENFSALVKKYTADTASASTGGLYEGITRDSSYVEEFRAWAVDTSRKEGDTGLVKTIFGYHIMYYVGGEAEWIYYGRGLQQEKNLAAMEEQLKKLLEENPAEVSRDLILMQNAYAR